MRATPHGLLRDWPRLTIGLLLFGWLLWGVGAMLGLLLLWTSGRWSTREKIQGTLIPVSEPFLALCFIVPSLTSFVALAATGSSIIAIVVVLVIFNGLRALIPGLSYQP